MQSNLKIPDDIKVGFVNRTDTYSGKLAYVISKGRKGKKKADLKSWIGWRDDNIDPEKYENLPTEGFVLNKDVGGTQRSYSWNARREKVRCYDPRGFEVEISVENVLLILQECSSIKGKGLEGEFIYSWSGSQLVLLPVCSQEYKTAMGFIELGDKKVTKKDMVEGCTYLTKEDKNVMYMGRHSWFGAIDKWSYGRDLTGQKKHIFLRLDKDKYENKYAVEAGFTKLAKKTSDEPSPNFADEYEALLGTSNVSNPEKITVKGSVNNIFKNDNNYNYYGTDIYVVDGEIFYSGVARRVDSYRRNYGFGSHIKQNDELIKFDIELSHKVFIKDGQFVKKPLDNSIFKNGLSVKEVYALVKNLYIECENGSEYKI
jgi:hypothetical protein